jgi:hypothetical protein
MFNRRNANLVRKQKGEGGGRKKEGGEGKGKKGKGRGGRRERREEGGRFWWE